MFLYSTSHTCILLYLYIHTLQIYITHKLHTYCTYILYCILYHNNILLYLYQYLCIIIQVCHVCIITVFVQYYSTKYRKEVCTVCISMNIFHTTVFTRGNVISTIDYCSAQVITVHAGIDYNMVYCSDITLRIFIQYVHVIRS